MNQQEPESAKDNLWDPVTCGLLWGTDGKHHSGVSQNFLPEEVRLKILAHQMARAALGTQPLI